MIQNFAVSQLRRELGRWDLTAIGINQVIGGAVFALPAALAALIGGWSPFLIVAVGLASGHVQTYRLPAGADGEVTSSAARNGYGHIDTVWKTRRHKGSCRTLGFSIDGAQLYSAGTDGIVKVADSATGKVSAKIAVPLDPYGSPNISLHIQLLM